MEDEIQTAMDKQKKDQIKDSAILDFLSQIVMNEKDKRKEK